MDILCWCLQRLFLSKNERKFDYLYGTLDNSAYYGLELNQQNYRLGERLYRDIKLNQYILFKNTHKSKEAKQTNEEKRKTKETKGEREQGEREKKERKGQRKSCCKQ